MAFVYIQQLCVTVLITFYLTVPRIEAQRWLCPEGWSNFNDAMDGVMCILPVNQPSSWEEADDFCTNKYSHLLKLDLIHHYQSFEALKAVSLGSILFDDGFQDFWTGMHATNGRLMWSAYGPEYVKRSRFDQYIRWAWAEGQPSTEKGTCGSVNLGSRTEERQNSTTEATFTVEVFNDQYGVTLTECTSRRQFVCQRPAVENFVRRTSRCEQGWVGNSRLADCYRVFNKPENFSSYEVAEKQCQKIGGQIAPDSTDLDLEIAATVNDFFYYEVESPRETEGTWIYNSPDRKDGGECQALSTVISDDGGTKPPITTGCDKELPFMCRKPAKYNEPKRLQISSVYTSQAELQSLDPFIPLPVSCMMSRPPTDSEILFIETPDGIINSTDNWRISQGFQIETSGDTDKPYFFNVTIPEIMIPQRKRRSLHDFFRAKRQSSDLPSTDEIVRTTGYYSCGFQSLFPPLYKDTESILVRYSETDVFIYIAQVTARIDFISPGEQGQVTPEDVTAFNLMKDMSYLTILGEYLGTVMNQLQIETSWSLDVYTYRAVLEKISGRVFQFRVFVGIENSRSLQPGIEQEVMNTIETYWAQRIRQIDAFTRVEFKSTVMCPEQRVYGERQRSVLFPATKVGEIADSEDLCIPGTAAVASAECQGDYENGANWGPVTYTDHCLTDQGYLCPDGWTTFRYSFLSTCIMLVQKDYSWKEAAQHCDEKEGHLLQLDAIDEYSFNDRQQERSLSLGEYLFNADIIEIWSGMHIETGRLFWDGYYPQHVHRGKYDQRPWDWGPDQPSVMNGKCGKVYLGTSEETRDTGTTVTIFNNQYFVNLSSCVEPRKFVCERFPVSTQLSYTSSCDEDWVSNPHLPHCYKVFNGDAELTTYATAEQECQNKGGNLVPVVTDYDRTIATTVNDFYSMFNYDYPEMEVSGIWIYNPPSETIVEGTCKALQSGISDGQVFDTINVQCDIPLPFMCRKSKLPTEPVKLKLASPYQEETELLEYAPFSPLPISLKLPRLPLASEVLYVRTPEGIFNSTNNWKKTLGFAITTGELKRTYVVNITIPKPSLRPSGGDLATTIGRAKRQVNNPDLARANLPNREEIGTIGDNLFAAVAFEVVADEIERTVGFYSFGFRSIFPPAYTETEPILVRYSESDLFIYIAELRLKDEFIVQNGISEEDFVSFSLLQDRSYIDLLREFQNLDFLDSLDGGAEWLEAVHTYRRVLESYSQRTLYARVFVGVTNSRAAPAELEQTVLSTLRRRWRDAIEDSNVFERVRFKSTVACPLQKYERIVDDVEIVATFPSTRVGETAYSWERCYKESGALASAECQGGFKEGAKWSRVVFRDSCKKVPDLPESNSTTSLRKLSEMDLTTDNIVEIIKNTSYLTLPTINLTETDIIYVADILYNAQLFGYIDETVFDFIITTVNNVLDTAFGLIAKAQTLDNSANRIIKALDDLTHMLGLIRIDTKRFIKRFLVAEVLSQSPSSPELTVGISLSNNRSDTIDKDSEVKSITAYMDVPVDEIDVGLYLPANLLKGGLSRLTFHLYGKSDLFAPVGGRYKTNSKVAAARLTLDNEPITDLGTNHVTAVFLPYEDDEFMVCGFWDYTVNENGGGWKIDGCNSTKEEDRVICKCNHLTNFAVLIDLEGHSIPDVHKEILSIITMVGLIVSIIGLALTILGFVMFKHLRDGRGQQVLVMLSLAMLCSAIIFLAGINRTSNRTGCIVVAALLHYFILVSFMWMLVEGVLQYLRFVKVLGTYIPRFLIKSAIPAWGIPLIPVIVVLAIDYNMYYGDHGYCWLSFMPMLYAFIIPVAVIIFINIIVFTLVLCNLCKRRNKGMMVNQSERKLAFLHFQAALSIFVVLGLTWAFGFLAIDNARVVFHYIFAILNAFQGFFIFLLFTAREKKIRQAWAKFCCGRKYKEKSSAHSGSDTRAPRKTSQDTSGMTGSTGSGARFTNLSYDNGQHLNGNN